MDFQIYVQILGVVGFLCGVTAYLNRKDVRLKILIGVASFIMAMHFYLLGAYVGVAAAMLSGVRSFCAANPNFRRLAPLFFLAYVPMAFIKVEVWVDVLPIISGLMATYAMFYLDLIKMRVLLLGATGLWLVHNGVHGSIGGVALEAFYIGANLLTIYGMRKKTNSLKAQD